MTLLLPFLGAVLGALLTGVIAESYRRHRDRQSIASSVNGEMGAILDMTARRNYVADFTHFAATLRKGHQVGIPDILRRPLEYDPIISRVGERVGVLGGNLPERIVGFYTRLMGIRVDLQKLADGIWDANLNSKANVIEEDLRLWEETVSIGNEVRVDLTKIAQEKWLGIFP